jgi:sulfate transport system substrate-binding protein
MSTRPRLALAAAATVGALVMTACAGGGASDTVGAAAADAGAATSTINLYAYAVPKVGFDKVIPAFTATDAGKGVQFQQSYGASGDQSRKVAAGASADVVNFSVEPDITRLVDAGLVAKDWNANEHKGVPFGSVVTIVVRKGNPKAVRDWDDLLQPGLEVVTPNPFSSGSAKWNSRAPATCC